MFLQSLLKVTFGRKFTMFLLHASSPSHEDRPHIIFLHLCCCCLYVVVWVYPHVREKKHVTEIQYTLSTSQCGVHPHVRERKHAMEIQYSLSTFGHLMACGYLNICACASLVETKLCFLCVFSSLWDSKDDPFSFVFKTFVYTEIDFFLNVKI